MSRKSTDTKEQILNTATNLFSTHGFDATSIDDILQAVGITKGAFYHYFNTKEHLCETVLDIAIAQYHQLAKIIQQQDLEPSENLLHWLEALIEKQHSGQWLYFRLITRLSIESAQLNSTIQQKLRRFWVWSQSLYETLIRQAAGSGFPETFMEPAALARLFMAAHFGALWLDRCAPAKEDITTVCETLLGQLIRLSDRGD